MTDGVEVTGLDDAGRRRAFASGASAWCFRISSCSNISACWTTSCCPIASTARCGSIGRPRERARDLAERVGIADKLARPATRLSQGEMQRVAVCRALIADPPLLLADEPTGNLDPVNTAAGAGDPVRRRRGAGQPRWSP